MKKNEEIYKELNKKYTDEELVDSFIFSIELPKDEEKRTRDEFLKLRFEKLKSMSEVELVASKLFAFKLRLKEYFKTSKFNAEFTFANQLRKYIEITNRSNLEIADNLGIHKTKLSRLVNSRENPNIDIMYRLEEHSSKEIPAFYWWRLHARELEYKIRTDFEKKNEEAKKVESPLNIRA